MSFKKTFNLKDIKNSIDKSLKLYGNLNCVYLHNPRNEIKDWNKIIKVLEDYKKKMLIKKIGISLAKDFFFKNNIINKFDVVMDEFNLLRTNNIDRINKINSEFIVRSVFANGLLAKKKITKLKLTGNDQRKNWLNKERAECIEKQIQYIKEKFLIDLRILSLSLILTLNKFDKMIIGVKNVYQVRWLADNLKNIKKLKKKELNYILNLNKKKFYQNKKMIY